MRSDFRPEEVFGLVPGRSVVCICILVLQLFSWYPARAQEISSESVANEVVVQQEVDRPLEAFARPSREAAEAAVFRIWVVLAIAAGGFILIILGTALWYESPSWAKPYEPTNVERAPGVVITPRSHRGYED